MKKAMYLLIAMMMLFLCTCTKDEGFLSDSSRQDDLLKKAPSKGAVFTVSPNDVDDTQNIIDAFDEAKLAGPGSVVQLTEGTFNIGFIEIRDFQGYFRGAGKDKTKIRNVEILPSCQTFYDNNMFEILLNFVGGDVQISRMTFATRDGNICPTSLFGILYVFLGLSDYTSQYVPANRFIRAVVEDVDFNGGYLNTLNVFGTDHNVWMILFIGANYSNPIPNPITNYPFSTGEVTIRRCGFEHAGDGIDCWGLDSKSILISEGNTMKNCFYNLFIGGWGMKGYIRNNKMFDAPMGALIDDNEWGLFPFWPLKKRSEFYISDNYFQSLTGSTLLTLIDTRRTIYPDEGSPQLFDIKGNTFVTQGGGTAILSQNNVNAKIWNNKFTGSGSIGVMIDGTEATDTWAENNSLIGNNFFNATYTEATVYLGPYSMNCKVVGVATDQVFDEGPNNSVVGTKAQKKGVQSSQYLQNNVRNAHEKLMRRGRL